MKISMKNIKLFYFLKNIFIWSLPTIIFRFKKKKILNSITEYNSQYIKERVNYYIHATEFNIANNVKDNITGFKPIKIAHFKRDEQCEAWVYFFDLYKYAIYFNQNNLFYFWPGDKISSPHLPNIMKSRPIDNNDNCVLINMDKVRHFNFISDPFSHEQKEDKVMWRGASWQPHRIKMLENLHHLSICNVGSNKPINDNPYLVDFLSIKEQLKYKFILCPEGNDVATNLKWVMSSNSIAVMPKPKYETWFMEGKLEAGVHYIEVSDDYSDVAEKISYYLNNKNDAKKIIDNAHKYIEQFSNKKQEDLISLLVLDNYFKLSNQDK